MRLPLIGADEHFHIHSTEYPLDIQPDEIPLECFLPDMDIKDGVDPLDTLMENIQNNH